MHGIDLAVHMIYMSVHISSLFITRTWRTILCYQYCLDVYNFVLVWYYVIEQEYDFLYVLSSDRYIPPKNGQGRWSAFLYLFFKNTSKTRQCLYINILCRAISVHEKAKMLQER